VAKKELFAGNIRKEALLCGENYSSLVSYVLYCLAQGGFLMRRHGQLPKDIRWSSS
jgi:hypothetical protein